ncbi:MAG: HAD family hydrolase [candidate division KSB1 bacterium]|nr:HAD family hydrolase [candidate division KSB1 bacterium]
MKPLYKHVIWDWNGTLINDMWLCVDILNPLLRKYGQPPITQSFYLEHFDFPVRDFYERAGFDFTHVPFEIVGTEWMTIYRNRCKECSLHEQARNTLNSIKRKGLGQSIVSASDISLLSESLQYFDVHAYFQKISGLDNHYAEGKVDIARHHIQELGMAPENVLFVGDTLHDFQVAGAIGVDCLLFSGGHHAKVKLQQSKIRIIDSLSEICKILEC